MNEPQTASFTYWMDSVALSPYMAKYDLQRAMELMSTMRQFREVLVWIDWIIRHGLKSEFMQRVNMMPTNVTPRKEYWAKYWQVIQHHDHILV